MSAAARRLAGSAIGELLDVRRREITPLIPHILRGEYRCARGENDALDVVWRLRDGGTLRLIANLGARPGERPAESCAA